MAVNVTELPLQIVDCVALMLTVGTINGVTDTVIEFDVTLVGVAHAALLVNTQLITSPLDNREVECTAAVAPVMLLPFFFH